TLFPMHVLKQQLGISVRAWDEHMYEMKQLTQRKVSQMEASAYFDAVFNNSTMNNVLDQEDNIIQFYRDVALQAQANGKDKAEP
ncbi:DUF932 domain-containing protein, partial [Acinetobacter baumannii]